VEIATQVVGYERRDSRTRQVIAREPLDLPPSCLVTRAFWYTVDDDLLARARVAPAQLAGALHAAEHAAIGILPLFTICDRWDVGGVSTPFQPDTSRPTIVIYDGYPGGVGIAELGFAAGRRHLDATLAVIERCPCARGCPSCVQSPKCGNGNEPLDKAAAVALLRTILASRSADSRPRRRAGGASRLRPHDGGGGHGDVADEGSGQGDVGGGAVTDRDPDGAIALDGHVEA
jgi:DEAD/DEAH box helicase domain-containing protein